MAFLAKIVVALFNQKLAENIFVAKVMLATFTIMVNAGGNL